MTTGEIRDSSRTPGTAAALTRDARSPSLPAYVAAAFLGRLTTFGGTPFALIWPAAGVAVLWFLLRRRAGWPASTPSCWWSRRSPPTRVTGVSPEQSVVLALTNLIQTLVAVTLMRRWCPDLWGCGGRRPARLPVGHHPATSARWPLGMAAGLAVGWVGTLVVQNELTLTRAVLWFDRNFCGALAVTTLGLLGGPVAHQPGRAGGWSREGAPSGSRSPGRPRSRRASTPWAFALESLPMAFPLLVATVWVGLRFATLLSVLHSLVLGTMRRAADPRRGRPVRGARERGDLDPARAVLPRHAAGHRPAARHRP